MKCQTKTKPDPEFLASQEPFTVFSVKCCMEGVLTIQQVVMEWEMKPCLRWGEDQDLLLLNLFFEPWDHLNFGLPSQAPPAALTALPEQDLSLPELFEISPLNLPQW